MRIFRTRFTATGYAAFIFLFTYMITDTGRCNWGLMKETVAVKFQLWEPAYRILDKLKKHGKVLMMLLTNEG